MAAFIRRGVRRGFCPFGLLIIDDLVCDMDDELSDSILVNHHYVLCQLLPPHRPNYTLLDHANITIA